MAELSVKVRVKLWHKVCVKLWHSLIVDAPLLCRAVRHARWCGALGCLHNLGIVITRQHSSSTFASRGDCRLSAARSCRLLGVHVFSFNLALILVWFSV